MLLHSYDIVFQEVPGEVTLALNLAGCPNHCEGCHSPHLQLEVGTTLDATLLATLLDTYGGAITCICFMGGDAEPREVERFALLSRALLDGRLKTAWYSGKTILAEECSLSSFDYLKLGPYIARLGGLDSPETNQRFYRIENGIPILMNQMFQKQRKRE
ncbi:MAG: anaerobic ribonucleoside-triphosphate reductase activating protein [Bacteroidales bacterium]